MKETVGQSNPEDLEASRPETKSGIADELAEIRKEATGSSHDISSRTPKIDLSKLGFQDVVVTPEDRVAKVEEDPKPRQVPWLHALEYLREIEATSQPKHMIDHATIPLSKEKLQLQAERLFKSARAARAFDRLLTRFAIESGQLEQLVTELKLRHTNTTLERVLAAIIGGPAAPGRYPDDYYKFSEALLDIGTSQPNCMKIIELHADALASATDRLREAEKTLEVYFDEDLQRCIEEGIIPASAQPAAGSPREYRYKRLHVYASDPVMNSFKGVGGHFNPTDNVIQIDAAVVLTSNLVSEYGNPVDVYDLDDVYYHERLHALSGATVVLDNTVLYDTEDEDVLQLIEAQRDANRHHFADVEEQFNSYDGDRLLLNAPRVGLASRFNNINEAYTEWAAMQLRGDSYDQVALWQTFNELYAEQILSENNLVIGNELIGNGPEQHEQWKKFVKEYGRTYLANRIMMAGLVHAGVDMLVLGEAYFESYEPKRSNPDREPGNAAPARRALDRAIAEHTPYKSLEQLQRALDVLAKERFGASAGKVSDWYKAALLSELLQPGAK